jgi:hypothetical protein
MLAYLIPMKLYETPIEIGLTIQHCYFASLISEVRTILIYKLGVIFLQQAIAQVKEHVAYWSQEA